jgi:hypothetical protein
MTDESVKEVLYKPVKQVHHGRFVVVLPRDEARKMRGSKEPEPYESKNVRHETETIRY